MSSPMTTDSETLGMHVREHVSLGCADCHGSLGFAAMPKGYELMRDADGYHYWLRADGVESDIDWNKWRIRRGAIANASLVAVSAAGGCDVR